MELVTENKIMANTILSWKEYPDKFQPDKYLKSTTATHMRLGRGSYHRHIWSSPKIVSQLNHVLNAVNPDRLKMYQHLLFQLCANPGVLAVVYSCKYCTKLLKNNLLLIPFIAVSIVQVIK